MLKSYLKYLKERQNAHGLHSPFVFEFYNEIIKKSKGIAFPEIEGRRKDLKRNKSVISIKDLGAGSRVSAGEKRTVSKITRNSSTTKKFGQLLGRIISFYELKHVLELGTSVGIGTAYMSKANAGGEICTIEGCPEIAELAKSNFSKLGLKNVDLKVGDFKNELKLLEQKHPVYDLIYIDGNHQKEATLNYFEFAMNHTHDESFIIFDDISWSKEMKEAWHEIKASANVNVSIDLFRLGIVCKRKGQRKQDFVLKF